MVRRSTWILLLVFGLLVVFAWFFSRKQTNNTTTVATSSPTVAAQKLYSLTDTQVTGMTITNSNGESIVLYRDSSTSNKWAIKDIPVDQADSVQIETVISQLLSLQISDTLTQSPPLEAIGLSTPAYTITMTTTDGKQVVTEVGSLSAIGTGYYLRVDSSPVFLVDNIVMEDALNLLKKPPLVATATPEVTENQSGTPVAPNTPTP